MKWLLAIPLGIAAVLAAVAGGDKKKTEVKGNKYTLLHWTPYIAPLCMNARVSIPFALGWIRVESGGNPCAWGSAKSKGPDGHPREQGIGQFYNPDDFTRYGIPSGSLRVYCVPNSQSCSRELTDEEMSAQARYLLALITHCREVAGAASAKSDLRWTGKDMYRLTKLVHGLPGLVKQGVPRTTLKLGRAPNNWDEFKSAIASTKLDDGTERYRALFPRLFLNAEKVASSLSDDVKIVT